MEIFRDATALFLTRMPLVGIRALRILIFPSSFVESDCLIGFTLSPQGDIEMRDSFPVMRFTAGVWFLGPRRLVRGTSENGGTLGNNHGTGGP